MRRGARALPRDFRSVHCTIYIPPKLNDTILIRECTTPSRVHSLARFETLVMYHHLTCSETSPRSALCVAPSERDAADHGDEETKLVTRAESP
jgi:hypothetical protein